MSIYVYAIVAGDRDDVAGLRGIADAVVEAVPIEDLAAVVSRHDEIPEAGDDALVAHDSVCSALMAGGPVVPVRFGAVFSDPAALRADLAARARALGEALARVEGHVELGVRALRTGADGGARESETDRRTGTDYLRGRLAARQEGRKAGRAVDERLRVFAGARRGRLLETPELVLSASYLVPTEAVDAFRAALDELARERSDLTLVCTGPWPPYSFVEGES